MQHHLLTDRPSRTALSTMDDEEILENIDGRMHGPMSGFIDKYFGGFQYAYQQSV
jgi:hypothetical protein